MTYTGLLNQDLIRAHNLKAGDKLPPIMPIVLYNCREAWTGPEDVKDLIQPVHNALAAYTLEDRGEARGIAEGERILTADSLEALLGKE